MTRDEQIEIALHDVHPKHEAGFKIGVKWADRNPSEPLYSRATVEGFVEWMKDYGWHAGAKAWVGENQPAISTSELLDKYLAHAPQP